MPDERKPDEPSFPPFTPTAGELIRWCAASHGDKVLALSLNQIGDA